MSESTKERCRICGLTEDEHKSLVQQCRIAHSFCAPLPQPTAPPEEPHAVCPDCGEPHYCSRKPNLLPLLEVAQTIEAEQSRITLTTMARVSLSIERYNELVKCEASLQNTFNIIEGMAYCDSSACFLRQHEIASNFGAHIHKPMVVEAINNLYFSKPQKMAKWVEDNATAFSAHQKAELTREHDAAIAELRKYLNQCEGETVVGGIRNMAQALMSREEEIEQLAKAEPELASLREELERIKKAQREAQKGGSQ
jgi:hypothetical protein